MNLSMTLIYFGVFGVFYLIMIFLDISSKRWKTEFQFVTIIEIVVARTILIIAHLAVALTPA